MLCPCLPAYMVTATTATPWSTSKSLMPPAASTSTISPSGNEVECEALSGHPSVLRSLPPHIKGVRAHTLKAIGCLQLFLLFASGYYGIKIKSLRLEQITSDLILAFPGGSPIPSSQPGRTRNQRLAAIKSFAKMIRLLYPDQRQLAETIFSVPRNALRNPGPHRVPSTRKRSSRVFHVVNLKKKKALGITPSSTSSRIQAPEPLKSPLSTWILQPRAENPGHPGQGQPFAHRAGNPEPLSPPALHLSIPFFPKTSLSATPLCQSTR